MIRTTAMDKIRRMKKRIKVIQGGTYAGKTYSIIPLLMDRAIYSKNEKITVVAETLPSVKEGALDIFKEWMQSDELDNWEERRFNGSSLTYTFQGGTRIQFKSFNTEGKAKASGKRDVLFLNEGNHLSWGISSKLITRSREIYIDYNPDVEFWVHKEILTRPDAELLTLTYLDNEGVPEENYQDLLINREKGFFDPYETDIKKLYAPENIKNNYWANWWRVYGLGLTGRTEDVIFQNWGTIAGIPPDARLLGYGLDFGFTNDPTALIEVWKWNDKRILNEVIYQTGLLNPDIVKFIKPGVMVYADSADPKSIKEISRMGRLIKGADKGKDSIVFGIQLMQQQEYLITEQSRNLINEFRKYVWMKDRDGRKLNKPVDAFNHCFVGDTEIRTPGGKRKIKDIREGDKVWTPLGVKKVLKAFDNGKKQVSTYRIKLGTFTVSLTCTDNHKIKTLHGWRKISELRPGEKVYLFSPLREKNIGYTLGKDILAGEISGCISLYGKDIMEKDQRAFMFIMSMGIAGITSRKILNWLKSINIFKSTGKKGLKTILNGLKGFGRKVLKRLKNGTGQKKAWNGTENRQEKQVLERWSMGKGNASFADLNSRQDQQDKSIVPTNVNQHTEKEAELMTRLESALNAEGNSYVISTISKENAGGGVRVYDLMVEDAHCYYANGILVHNCVDAIRYHEVMNIRGGKIKVRNGRFIG